MEQHGRRVDRHGVRLGAHLHGEGARHPHPPEGLDSDALARPCAGPAVERSCEQGGLRPRRRRTGSGAHPAHRPIVVRPHEIRSHGMRWHDRHDRRRSQRPSAVHPVGHLRTGRRLDDALPGRRRNDCVLQPHRSHACPLSDQRTWAGHDPLSGRGCRGVNFVVAGA